MLELIWIILIGAVVGVLAKFLMPGPDPDAFVAALERFLSIVRFAESGTVHAAASRPVEVSARGA